MTVRDPRSRRDAGLAVALGAILTAGVGLRAAHLGIPLRYDEALTWMEYAAPGWAHASTAYDTPNNHVLHTLLVWLSTRVAGPEPWAIRAPAFLAGCLLPLAVAMLALRLHGRRAALLAAAFVAASPILIEYSTNARGYGLVALATVASVAFARRLLERPHPIGWAGLAATAALGAYTVPIMLLPWAGVVVWLAANLLLGGGGGDGGPRRRPGRLRGLLTLAAVNAGVGVLVAALYLPLLTVGGADALGGNRFVSPLSVPELLEALPRTAGAVLEHWTRGVPPPLVAVLAAGLVAAPLLARRSQARARPFPLGGALALGAALVLLVVRNPGEARVWLWALPLLLMAAAAGLVALAERWRRGRAVGRGAVAAAAAGWLLVHGGWTLATGSVFASLETGGYPEVEAVADELARRMGPGDGVVTDFVSWEPLRYYLRRSDRVALPLRIDPAPGKVAWVLLNHGDPGRADGARERARRLGIRVEDGRPVTRVGDTEIYGFRSSR